MKLLEVIIIKAVILCQSQKHSNNVYSPKIREKLKEIVPLTDKVYKKQDVLQNPELFEDTEFIFSTWGMPVFSEEEIKKYFKSLKCVFYAAGSVQEFARPFINCGIKIFSAWAANAVPVAEYTVAQIILANKGFFASSNKFKKGYPKEAKELFLNYPGNYDSKIGIIGAGMIGKLVIKMLKSYDVDVLVFDPFLNEIDAERLGVEKTDLVSLFSNCNVISNHLANNEQTKGMLTGSLFEKMNPYSTFINTGRGAQVVEEELIEVLKNRLDITALLDVTDPEPPLEGNEFYSLPNCILTPHIAGSSGNEVCRMAEYMLKEYNDFSSGKTCKYEVTYDMLNHMA